MLNECDLNIDQTNQDDDVATLHANVQCLTDSMLLAC